jgi:hypothetical protein
MKCLSVRQPWAWAIVAGVKDVENRSWVPSPRFLKVGDSFLIHASQKFDGKGYRWILENCALLGVSIDEVPARDEFALGAIVGVAIYGGAVDESSSPWFFGPKGWLIDRALDLVDPIFCKGALGLWDLDEAMSWKAAEDTGSRIREACPTTNEEREG